MEIRFDYSDGRERITVVNEPLGFPRWVYLLDLLVPVIAVPALFALIILAGGLVS